MRTFMYSQDLWLFVCRSVWSPPVKRVPTIFNTLFVFFGRFFCYCSRCCYCYWGCCIVYLIQWNTTAVAIFTLALFILKAFRFSPFGSTILEPNLKLKKTDMKGITKTNSLESHRSSHNVIIAIIDIERENNHIRSSRVKSLDHIHIYLTNVFFLFSTYVYFLIAK